MIPDFPPTAEDREYERWVKEQSKILPAVYDSKLLKLAVTIEENKYKNVQKFFDIGLKIHKEEFGELTSAIRLLNHKMVDGGGWTMEPPKQKTHVPPDNMKEIFREFCQEWHPDKNVEDTSEIFVEIKTLYEEGDYAEFIEKCRVKDISNPYMLYEKWKQFKEERTETEKSMGYSIGYSHENNRQRWHKLMLTEWKKLRSQIDNMETELLRNRAGLRRRR